MQTHAQLIVFGNMIVFYAPHGYSFFEGALRLGLDHHQTRAEIPVGRRMR